MDRFAYNDVGSILEKTPELRNKTRAYLHLIRPALR